MVAECVCQVQCTLMQSKCAPLGGSPQEWCLWLLNARANVYEGVPSGDSPLYR